MAETRRGTNAAGLSESSLPPSSIHPSLGLGTCCGLGPGLVLGRRQEHQRGSRPSSVPCKPECPMPRRRFEWGVSLRSSWEGRRAWWRAARAVRALVPALWSLLVSASSRWPEVPSPGCGTRTRRGPTSLTVDSRFPSIDTGGRHVVHAGSAGQRPGNPTRTSPSSFTRACEIRSFPESPSRGGETEAREDQGTRRRWGYVAGLNSVSYLRNL